MDIEVGRHNLRQSQVVLLVLFFTLSALAQTSEAPPAQDQQKKIPAGSVIVYEPPANPSAAPFGSQLRKAVSVIREDCKDDTGQLWSASGTAFIVAYRDPRLPEGQLYDYLVTNRHVAECMDENLKPRKVLSAKLQANTKAGNTVVLSMADVVRWYFPADDSVDLAVTPILPQENFQPLVISMGDFFLNTDFQAQRIAEGAKIILSGYFYQLDGSSKLEPLVREGILSMIPDEPLNTALKKPGKIYLGEVHIFGGNSGSPVFISLEGLRGDHFMFDGPYRLLGVVSGYYYEDSDLNLRIATTLTGTQRANSGITMIVPADLLKDLILNNRELVGFRDSYFAQTQVKK
jgi:hypothetical protein